MRLSISIVMSQRIRILHVINGEFYSGAERVQDLLALRLPEFGFDVGFACLKPGRFPGLRQSQKAPLYKLPMRSRLDFTKSRQLAELVQNGHYKLVHTHTPRAAMIGRIASFFANVPIVHHVHSPTIADTHQRWRNWLNTIMERASLVGARHLIVVSENLKDYLLRQGLPEERISVVRNGVPVQNGLKERLAPMEKWRIGMVALFRPRKGLEILLNAFSDLKARGFPLHLLAVGPFETDAYENAIKQMAEQLGVADSIEWVGFTKHVNRELARMDVFVLPSLFGEGLPMVIIEAMTSGVPVIASRVGGIPEAIRDGKDGLLVESGSPLDLAQALERVMTGGVDWHVLRINAYERHAQAFSDRIMAQGVARVYAQVLGA